MNPARFEHDGHRIASFTGKSAIAELEGPLIAACERGHFDLVDQFDSFPLDFTLLTIKAPRKGRIQAYALVYPGVLAMFEARDTQAGAVLFHWISEHIAQQGALVGFNLQSGELSALLDVPEPDPLSLPVPGGSIPMPIVAWGDITTERAASRLVDARLQWWSSDNPPLEVPIDNPILDAIFQLLFPRGYSRTGEGAVES